MAEEEQSLVKGNTPSVWLRLKGCLGNVKKVFKSDAVWLNYATLTAEEKENFIAIYKRKIETLQKESQMSAGFSVYRSDMGGSLKTLAFTNQLTGKKTYVYEIPREFYVELFSRTFTQPFTMRYGWDEGCYDYYFNIAFIIQPRAQAGATCEETTSKENTKSVAQ
jgi:hypothetical protein